jgi:hypothetical protein
MLPKASGLNVLTNGDMGYTVDSDDMDQRQALVNTGINIPVPRNAAGFLTS